MSVTIIARAISTSHGNKGSSSLILKTANMAKVRRIRKVISCLETRRFGGKYERSQRLASCQWRQRQLQIETQNVSRNNAAKNNNTHNTPTAPIGAKEDKDEIVQIQSSRGNRGVLKTAHKD